MALNISAWSIRNPLPSIVFSIILLLLVLMLLFNKRWWDWIGVLGILAVLAFRLTTQVVR